MYGKLNFGKGQLCLTAKTLNDLAKRIITNAIAEEQGKNVNDFDQYLNGWVECLNECRDGEGDEYTMSDVPTQAADNLVYSNAHYYNGSNPLTSDEKTELFNEVEKLLENLIEILA
jgi:hypothetical protein